MYEDLKDKVVLVTGVICDLSVDSDIEKLMKQTIDEFGQLDVLVNNAAYDKRGNILDADTLSEFDMQMN
ncbi:L-xylulose reductase-like protein, partial [Leptotrombidium deliense]